MSWDVTKKRGNDRVICQSCRTKRAVTVQNGEHKCLPWHGKFASDMVTPIDELGEEVLPGQRICGNLDCVAPQHITEGK